MEATPRRTTTAARERHDAAGQALVVALILLVLAAVLVLGTVYFFQENARHHAAHSAIIEERYLAEAGLQMTLQRLNTDETFSREIQEIVTSRNPFDSAAAPATIAWGGGTITVVIEPY